MDLKYFDLLDKEIQEYITLCETFYPADAVDAPIAIQRKYYDDLCQSFDGGHPDGVETVDRLIKAQSHPVAVRNYTNKQQARTGLVFYIHGGGYVVGGLESHDSICADICAVTGQKVVAVDYRLAPEHPHPAAFEDCLTALRSLLEETQRSIVIVGDSAGGNLAAALCHFMRGKTDRILGQVLIYPGLGPSTSSGSYVEHTHAPLLTTDDVKFYERIRADDRDLSEDPTANPLSDSDFSGLPETIVFAAECDPLADDGRRYCDRITSAQGKATFHPGKGLVHGYLRARSMSRIAQENFEAITSEIARLAGG